MHVQRRVLVLQPAILHAAQTHVHVRQRPVNAVDLGERKHLRGARLAAVLRRHAPFRRHPPGALELTAAQVHARGQILAGLEVHVVQAAVDLVFVVVGHRRGRPKPGLRLGASCGCGQQTRRQQHCNLHLHPWHSSPVLVPGELVRRGGNRAPSSLAGAEAGCGSRRARRPQVLSAFSQCNIRALQGGVSVATLPHPRYNVPGRFGLAPSIGRLLAAGYWPGADRAAALTAPVRAITKRSPGCLRPRPRWSPRPRPRPASV